MASSISTVPLLASYDPTLVALSVVIAIVASYVAFDLAERTTAARGRARALWLIGGSVCMGFGIWAMHYVGMLAYRLPVPVHYDAPQVGLSLLASVGASAIALLAVTRPRLTRFGLGIGALAMGAGIAGMHYIGMAAMRLQASCHVDAWRVALSAAVAVGGSVIALWLTFRLRAEPGGLSSRKVASAAIMGLAIAAMHYTGMSAASYLPSVEIAATAEGIGIVPLGLIDISLVTLLVFGLAVAMTFADRRGSQRALALRASERRYRLLFERSLAGVYRSTLDGTLLDCNDAFARVLGYSSREDCLANCAPTEHYPSPAERSAFVEQLQRDGRLTDFECRVSRRDGGQVWVLENATLLEPAGANPAEVEGTILDITSRKASEEALMRSINSSREANRAKSEFLANMSHEIRTPLNGILGTTELALSTAAPGPQREYLEMIQISADSLLKIISDILDFSKIEARKLDLDPVDFDLRQTLADITRPLAATARRKGLAFSLQVADDLPRAYHGDPARLQQILVNLLGNAIKFTDAGAVGLTASRVQGDQDAGSLLLTVSDTGIGIPKEKLGSVFDPFTQADASTTRRYGGTGLGLAIAAQLAELMGGRIWAESEAGSGSSFHVLLSLKAARQAPLQRPRVVPVPATTAPTHESSPDSSRRSLRVLVVEDNAINRIVVQRMLEDRGHRVTTAEDGLAAVEAVARESFDAVLMDVQMPRMDGFEATAEIRRRERSGSLAEQPQGHLPIVALTAHAMKGDSERCRAAGMDDYLTKPLRAADLNQALERLTAPRTPVQSAARVTTPKPAAPSAEAAAALDVTRLLGRLRGDRQLLREIVDLFESEGPRMMSEIKNRVRAGDAKGLEQAAHALRSCVGNFEASAASKAALALEIAGREDDWELVAPNLLRLERDMECLGRDLALVSGKACA